MMKKKVRIILLSSVMVSLIFFISLGIKTKAQDCSDCDPIPTSPGEADYCPMHPLKLDPNTPDEIECGTPETIKIIDGVGPFTWQVSGNGFTLSKINEREYSLSCSESSTCGDESGQTGAVATVTVIDSCEEGSSSEISLKIRNNSGRWSSFYAPDALICGGGGYDAHYDGYPVGDVKYRVRRHFLSSSDYIKCNHSCASQILGDMGSNGFPNSDNITFVCEFYSGHNGDPGYYIFVRDLDNPDTRGGFRSLDYRKSMWECP